ncbi:MAG: Gfo/Idh/MocA family oxidoreductase [Kiritimatiellia bacterium]
MSPNSKLNHACIGVGGMGGADISNIKTHPRTQIVALCDVDSVRLARAGKKFPGARTYTDWREMLAKEGDRIDSVNIAVPDHNHTVIAANAMRAGKHVYCQKPLCHEIEEARLLCNIAKEAGVVTQLGVQFSAGIGDRMNVEYLRQNAVGTVEHVYLFSTRSGVSRIETTRPAPAPVPDTLNWEIWLGTAPYRPYAKKLYHPLLWRIWRDFGSGWVGDIGCHLHSSIWKGLGLTAPIDVKAEVQESWKNTPARFNDTWPVGAHITWTYPGSVKTGGRPLTVDWYDGKAGSSAAHLLPPPELQELARKVGFEKLPSEGSVVAGSEGWILMPHGSAPRIIMKNKGAQKPQKPVLPKWPNHYHEFLNGCVDGHRTSADFSKVGPMVESVLLANVAERVYDTLLEWDAGKMRIMNSDKADAFLRRSYRPGWKLEGIA